MTRKGWNVELQASWRVREVGLRFGVMEEGAGLRQAAEVELPREGIVLITGASGSGKSTLLRWIARRLAAPVWLERTRLPRRAVVDCLGLPLEQTLAVLSRAGLAEARVWLRQPGELSEGEQFRFRLALWMARGRGRVLLADEFCNGLDRVTARGVAWQLRRFVDGARGERRLAVVATAHEDLVRDLMPELHVRMGDETRSCEGMKCTKSAG